MAGSSTRAGRFDSAAPAPLTLFGIPDNKAGVMRDEIAVLVLGSLVLTHTPNGEIRGLNDFSPDQRPPVGPPFFAFRIMVGAGLLMLALVGSAWLSVGPVADVRHNNAESRG